MALISPRSESASRSSCITLMLFGLILCSLPQLQALEEGDPCTLKGNLPGVCQGSSKCVPRIKKYIETRRLTASDIPTCGLSTLEEIVCCPIAECCADDQRQSSSSVNNLATPQPDSKESTWQNVASHNSVELTPAGSIIAPIGRTTPKAEQTNPSKPQLDPDLPFYDFSQMMSGKPKPQTPSKHNSERFQQPSLPTNAINEEVSEGFFQLTPHIGPVGKPFPRDDPIPIQSVKSPNEFDQIRRPTEHRSERFQRPPSSTDEERFFPQTPHIGPMREPFGRNIERPIQSEPSPQEFDHDRRPTEKERFFPPTPFPRDDQIPIQSVPSPNEFERRPTEHRSERFQRPPSSTDEERFFPQTPHIGPMREPFARNNERPIQSEPSPQAFNHDRRPTERERFFPQTPHMGPMREPFPTSDQRPQEFDQNRRPTNEEGFFPLTPHIGPARQPFATNDQRPIQSVPSPQEHDQFSNTIPNRWPPQRDGRPQQWSAPSRESRLIVNRPFTIEHQSEPQWGQNPINEINAPMREWPGTNSDIAIDPQTQPENPVRPIESNHEWNWQETTTTSSIQPAPSARTDVPRPAVQACRAIEKRELENLLTVHILDGIPVAPAFYPHMAAIAFNVLGNIEFGCGGSLISTRHILTAAHCVNNVDQTPVYVRLGTVNIQNVGAHYQDINVTSNIRVHPEYMSTSKYNDIAILELAEEARLDNYTYPVCLETDPFDPPPNSHIYVTGWGVVNTTTRRTSKILLRAPLTVVPLEQCNDSFAELPVSKRYLKKGIIDTLMCAADVSQGVKDACQGDSGGPLVLERDKENNKFSIMGIISAGFGCATTTPGLYTRVASFLDFIEGIVWPNGYEG